MIVSVGQLKQFLNDVSLDPLDEVRVEINDTMETRLVVVPSLAKRLKGMQTCAYFSLPSYEQGA